MNFHKYNYHILHFLTFFCPLVAYRKASVAIFESEIDREQREPFRDALATQLQEPGHQTMAPGLSLFGSPTPCVLIRCCLRHAGTVKQESRKTCPLLKCSEETSLQKVSD